LRLAVSLAEEFYRSAMITQTRRQTTTLLTDESAADCLDACLDAAAHIDANANQATLVDWWLDELALAAH
jgi:hypothetical protein